MVLRAYTEKERSIGQGNTELSWAIQVIFCCFRHCRSVVYDTSLWTRER